jgi:hypothetical protein
VNWTLSLVVKLDPPAGLEIETVGGVLATVIVVEALAVPPSASVTLAVMTCVPFVSFLVMVPPEPSAPSLLDDQAMDPVSEP